ncbi:MAG: efflux transporter outer membrane subunit [Verrucomicrobiota bacterium]
MKCKLVLGAGALIWITGCTVGPKYHEPTVATPAAWSSGAVAGTTTNALPSPPGWLAFNDPLLAGYLRQAVEANHDLRIGTERIREARALRREAGGRDDLQLAPNARFDNSGLSKNNERFGGAILRRGFVDRETDLFQLGFDASWEIDLFGATRRTVEAANARLGAVIYDRDHIALAVLAETARNYIELRGAQQRAAIVRTNISYLESTLRLVEERYTSGLGGELPVLQTKTLLDSTRAQLPTLEAAIRSGAHRLAVLLGKEPCALVAELERAQAVPAIKDPVPVGLPSELLRRRPDIQRAEREIAASTADVGTTTAELFPRFYLTGSPSLQSSSFTTLFNSDSLAWTVGPAVEWKLLTGGRVRARIEAAKAREAAALVRYEKTVFTALEEVENALTQYGREQQRLATLAQARRSSERAVELARTSFTEGLSDFLVVLDAERARNDVADQFIQSEVNVARQLVALLKSLGGGWEELAPAAQVSAATATASPTEKP